jgi:hypothetical protein
MQFETIYEFFITFNIKYLHSNFKSLTFACSFFIIVLDLRLTKIGLGNS